MAMSLFRNWLENDPLLSTSSDFGNILQTRQSNWLPHTDIKETNDSIVLFSELPGLTLDDVNVEVSNNVLSIRGEKKRELKEEKENYHRVERCYGSFFRSFQLPEGCTEDNVKACLKNGVLEVCVKKPEKGNVQSGPRKIQIQQS